MAHHGSRTEYFVEPVGVAGLVDLVSGIVIIGGIHQLCKLCRIGGLDGLEGSAAKVSSVVIDKNVLGNYGSRTGTVLTVEPVCISVKPLPAPSMPLKMAWPFSSAFKRSGKSLK